ncbi:MAG TPA: ThiF family adenylyltransferase [Pengzhenrongella sp.]
MTAERGAAWPREGVRAGAVPALVGPGAPLTASDVARFSRHLLLPGLGDLGQRRLRNARVCVVGAGGLGAPVLQYLAAAGVGTIGIVDSDLVELSNLQRQVIHGTADVGRSKVVSAAESVAAIDPEIVVVSHALRLTADTVDLLAGYDLVVDGTDNFATRYLVNDACVRWGLPLVWGSVLRFDAQISVFWGRPPVGSGVPPVELRDLFPFPPEPGSVPSCADAGVLGALCGQVGSLMATEAIKLITGTGRPLLGRVLVLDALEQRWSEVPLVGAGPAGSAASADAAAALHAGHPPAPPRPVAADDVPTLSARTLARLLEAAAGDEVPVTVIDVRETAELAAGVIPGSVSIPLGALLAGRELAGLPRDRPVVAVCHAGVRSEVAARFLLRAGYQEVAHLEGGMLAWRGGLTAADGSAR